MRQKFRRGDIVNVRATVRSDERGGDTGIAIDLGGYQHALVDGAEVSMLTPYFAAGEIALEPEGAPPELHEVTIMAVHDGAAWVKDRHGALRTVEVKFLVRKETAEAATEIAS